jgi:MFS family permease
MTGYRQLARNRDFTILWSGEAASQLGSAVSLFCFPLVGYALTSSAVLAGIPVAAFLLGHVAALLPAGVVVDRTDRRRLMLVASGSGVLLYASVAGAAAAGALTLPHLVVVAFLTGVGAGVFGPAEMSAVRTVVAPEDLPTALSQNQARQHVGALVGGPLGGLLYGVGRAVPFVFDAVTFAVSFVAISRLRTDLSAPRRGRANPLRRDLVEGLRYIAARPYFRTMVTYGAVSNLVVNAIFYVAIMRLIQADVAPAAIGLIETCAGLGGILGALAAPYVIDRLRTGTLTVLVAWSWVPLLLPVALWPTPWVIGAMLGLGLLLNPAGNAGAQSYRMAITPAELQGRIASASAFCSMSVMPLAPLLGGWLLERYGGVAATAGLALVAVVAALIPTLARSVRSVPRPAEWALPAETPAPEPVPA